MSADRISRGDKMKSVSMKGRVLVSSLCLRFWKEEKRGWFVYTAKMLKKKKEANDDYDAHLQFFSTLMGFPPQISSSIT